MALPDPEHAAREQQALDGSQQGASLSARDALPAADRASVCVLCLLTEHVVVCVVVRVDRVRTCCTC